MDVRTKTVKIGNIFATKGCDAAINDLINKPLQFYNFQRSLSN